MFQMLKGAYQGFSEIQNWKLNVQYTVNRQVPFVQKLTKINRFARMSLRNENCFYWLNKHRCVCTWYNVHVCNVSMSFTVFPTFPGETVEAGVGSWKMYCIHSCSCPSTIFLTESMKTLLRSSWHQVVVH